MMNKIFKKSYFLLPILLFLSISCGGSKNPAAPSGSVIVINPETVEMKASEDFPETWYSYYFTITVYENDDKINPMSDIELTLTFPWANPYQWYTVQFYHNGERVNSPLRVKTDKYGTYTLRFDYLIGGGREYKGQLEARSATAYATSDFDVSVE